MNYKRRIQGFIQKLLEMQKDGYNEKEAIRNKIGCNHIKSVKILHETISKIALERHFIKIFPVFEAYLNFGTTSIRKRKKQTSTIITFIIFISTLKLHASLTFTDVKSCS